MFAGKIYCPLPSGPHSSLLKTAALHKLFCATRVFRRKFAFMCGAAAVSALLAPSLYDEPAGPSWVGRRGKKNWLRLLLVIGEGVSRALVFAVRESVVGPRLKPRPSAAAAGFWGPAAFPWCSPPGTGIRA